MPSRASCAALVRSPVPRDRFDQIAALGADPAREPERQTVGGQPPGFIEVGPLGDQGVRRPHRHRPALERGAQLLLGRAHVKALAQSGHRPSQLIHGEQRHAMGRPVAEPKLALAGAHLVGESPSSRHHHDGTRRLRDGIEPGGELGRAHHAAAKLDHDRRCPDRNGRNVGRHAQGSARHGQTLPLERTISTPTAPGSLSSFSIMTVTRAARGWARQCCAIRSAKVSTKLMWPRATMSLMPLTMVS